MDLIDFILNLAGLLLWLNWRAAQADPLGKRKPATLLGTLRRADPGSVWTRWQLPAMLVGLLLLRAVFYWQTGSAAHWAGRVNLGIIALSFPCHENWAGLGRMIFFSFCSFGWALAVGYLWLLLLSILAGPEPFHSLVRVQLGRIDRWPRWLKLFLPVAASAPLFWLASWLFAWLQIIPPPTSVAQRLGQSLLIGLDSYLVWKIPAALLLVLHLLNNYIYFGKHPFWKYVDAAAQTLLRPLKRIPLRAAKVDFAPVVGIALVFLLAYGVQNGVKLFPRVGENGNPLPPLINIPGLVEIYARLSG